MSGGSRSISAPARTSGASGSSTSGAHAALGRHRLVEASSLRVSSGAHSNHRGHLDLVVGEQDGLAADREVAALRPADVVLGHQDPAQVGVAAEDDPEEVVGLALLELGGGEELDAGVDLGQRRVAVERRPVPGRRVRRAAP